MGQTMLRCLGSNHLRLPTTDHRDSEVVSMLLLPASHLRHQRIGKTTAGIREQQDHGLSLATQRIERHGLSIQSGQSERRSRGANGQASAWCLRTRNGSGVGPDTAAGFQRLDAEQEPTILLQQMHEEPSCYGNRHEQ